MKLNLHFVALSLALSLPAASLWACIYDGAGGPSEVDPAAPTAVFATQIAISDGELAAIEPLSGQVALQRSLHWLEQLRDLQEAAGMTGTLHIYLAEGGLWSRLSDQDDLSASSLLESAHRLKLQTHSLPPRGGERILIVTEAALAALVNQQLSLQQAQQLGIAKLKIKPYPIKLQSN
ncbi:hypothetical protein [Chitinibacter tainanensis]|uniref:hypothetical protein n=1 Tax=Chitinibacter tainanensis TaxID=230667 RepID=UPI002355FF6D|nr:hypothetical protein [Chitinibacter tainanensis]